MSDTWPPDYTKVFAVRQKRYSAVCGNSALITGAKEYYRNNPPEFIEHWGITYDPRNSGSDVPALMPFIMFDKQREFLAFVLDCLDNQENGLVEKCRDMGATWLGVALSVYLWMFWDGAAVGWGSRKESLVDRIGDPDSIFEKIRMFIDYVPRWLWPVGFSLDTHATYMRIINPETGATITGESGDNIGRGGRKLIYFKDESAHYERPEKIESALGDNTNVQIDISSVFGTANVFARRRKSGEVWSPGHDIPSGTTRIFIFDWRDHPAKTQEWYDKRRNKAEREGLLHLFAQEVDRDYAAAVEGVVIPDIWVKAAIDAHLKLNIEIDGMKVAGLDVADGGRDKNAIAMRTGILLSTSDVWAYAPDTGVTTQKAVTVCESEGCYNLQYDCIGVGAGVKAESNRLKREKLINKTLQIIPWNAAATPLNPKENIIKNDRESPTNRDFYANLKAQGWWKLRGRFERTYQAVTHGIKYDNAELISIDSRLRGIHELVAELSQATYGYDGKRRIIIDKAPDGNKSPNRADSVVIAYWPVEAKYVNVSFSGDVDLTNTSAWMV